MLLNGCIYCIYTSDTSKISDLSFTSDISQGILHHLQLVQNPAARLITVKKSNDHITPVLASDSLLDFKLIFKILLLNCRALNGAATEYISDLLTWYVHSKALRSRDRAPLVYSYSDSFFFIPYYGTVFLLNPLPLAFLKSLLKYLNENASKFSFKYIQF